MKKIKLNSLPIISVIVYIFWFVIIFLPPSRGMDFPPIIFEIIYWPAISIAITAETLSLKDFSSTPGLALIAFAIPTIINIVVVYFILRMFKEISVK